jgi:hypothetical protein
VVATGDTTLAMFSVDAGGQLQAENGLDTDGVAAQYVTGADLDGDGLTDLVAVGSGQLAVLLSK